MKKVYKGGCDCSSSFFSGGSCGTCTSCGTQNGGMNTTVGAPWTANYESWPGVGGVQGVSNHYPVNPYNTDLQTTGLQERTGPILSGGKRHKGRTSKRGGLALIPQDLVNMGRTLTTGVGNAYNLLNGYSPSVSPLPYVQTRHM